MTKILIPQQLYNLADDALEYMNIVRTTFALNLKTASYNLPRLVFLKARGVPAF